MILVQSVQASIKAWSEFIRSCEVLNVNNVSSADKLHFMKYSQHSYAAVHHPVT